MTSGSTPTYNRSVLALLLLLAALLRLEHITQPFIDKLSWREASTAMMAHNFYRGHWNILYPRLDWSGPGPGYQGREFQTVTYIAANLYRLCGQHEWVARSVTLTFGLWGIFALYQLISRVWDHDRALAGAALMSVLPGAVFIDRSFLPDPAMLSLVITSLWLLVAYCQTDNMRYLVLSSIAGGLGILTKIPGIIVGLPAGYAIYAILGRRALDRQRSVALLAAATSVALVVSGYYLWARYLSLTYPPHHFAGAHQFISLHKASHWLRQYYFVPDLMRALIGWLWTYPIVILVAIGLVLPSSTSSSGCIGSGPSCAPLFFHWYGAALVIQYLVEAQHLVEDPQNMVLLQPFAAATGGQAIVSILQSIRRRGYRPLGIGVTAVLVAVVIGLVGQQSLKACYTPTYSYESSYQIGKRIGTIANPKDLIISFGLNPATIYYSGLRGWVFPPAEVWHTSLGWDYGELDINRLKSLWEQGAKWLVISNSNDEYKNAIDLRRDNGPLWVYIKTNFELYDESEDGMIFRLPSYERQSRLYGGVR